MIVCWRCVDNDNDEEVDHAKNSPMHARECERCARRTFVWVQVKRKPISGATGPAPAPRPKPIMLSPLQSYEKHQKKPLTSTG